ncbi:nuclear transport factor 2 family protein [Subtercola sp. YIM 133946]|uniref:nuclear transport factor 2 family protein n=1 Tax=Subtercola sp. YIM 133946 TaxID=3118909 RepID=UPI002F94149F
MSPSETVQPVHPNVAFVVEAHERLESGDLASINEMFAADIVWHEFGSSPLAGSYRGRDAVMAFWKVYFTAAGVGFTQTIDSIMANDEFVSSIVQLHGSKGQIVFAQSAIDVMRMQNGRIAEFWRYYADLEAAEHFLSL